jgi:folate-binding protein YgfZ
VTGVIRRTDRTIIRMFGRDPLKMVQGLATNDIAGTPENEAVYTAFLTAKGKMIGDARVLRRPDGDIWIEADRDAAENIAANLKKFVPPLFARFESLESHEVIGLYGARAVEIAHGLPAHAVLTNAFRADALDLVFTAEIADHAESDAVESGAERIDFEQLEVMRVEAGEPKWGAELTEDVIPLEAGLRNVAISETKGCYTGQEIIIRILHRGHVNRHLRGILTGSTEVPAIGAELLRADDGRPVGRITSTCRSTRLGQAIALAYVRREIEPKTALKLDGRDAIVVELPFKPEP